MKEFGRYGYEYPKVGWVVVLNSDEFIEKNKRNPLVINEVIDKDQVVCISSLTHQELKISTKNLLILEDDDK